MFWKTAHWHAILLDKGQSVNMASYRMGCSHLVPSEILRQDPVVDVFRDAGKGSVDHLCAGSLGDAIRDGPSAGCIGEGEKLAIDTTSHLQNNQQKYILKKKKTLKEPV